jgi:hypothetical protein
VAQESRGTSEVPAASSSSPGSGTQTPVSHHGPGSRPQQQQREPHPLYLAATNVSNALCFVKVRDAVPLQRCHSQTFFRACKKMSPMQH